MSQMKSEDCEIPPLPPELMEPTDSVEWERQVSEAEAQIEAGFFTPHEEVMAWLLELAAGNNIPPPCDR